MRTVPPLFLSVFVLLVDCLIIVMGNVVAINGVYGVFIYPFYIQTAN